LEFSGVQATWLEVTEECLTLLQLCVELEQLAEAPKKKLIPVAAWRARTCDGQAQKFWLPGSLVVD